MRNWPFICSVWICRQGIYRNSKPIRAFRRKLLYISTNTIRRPYCGESWRLSLYTSKKRQILLQTQLRPLSLTTRRERKSLEVKWHYIKRQSSRRAGSDSSIWKQRAQVFDNLKTWNSETRTYFSRRLSDFVFRWAFQKLHLRIRRRKSASASLGGIYFVSDSRQNFRGVSWARKPSSS